MWSAGLHGAHGLITAYSGKCSRGRCSRVQQGAQRSRRPTCFQVGPLWKLHDSHRYGRTRERKSFMALPVSSSAQVCLKCCRLLIFTLTCTVGILSLLCFVHSTPSSFSSGSFRSIPQILRSRTDTCCNPSLHCPQVICLNEQLGVVLR